MEQYIESDLCPYLESLSKQKRLCDRCLKGTISIKPSLNPNGGYIVCTNCSRHTSISAPKSAEVPWDGKTPWRNPNKINKPKFRVIRGGQQSS